jgi:hypothetical protein
VAAVHAAKDDPVALAALRLAMTPKQFEAASNSAAAIDTLGSHTAAVHAAKDDPVALAALNLTMAPKQFEAASNSAAAIDTLGSNVAAVYAAKDDPVALAALRLAMTSKQFEAASNTAAHASNVAAVHAAKDDPVALAALRLAMTPKQFDAASNAAAAIDTLNEEGHTRAVNKPRRVLVELRGRSNKGRIFATTIEDVVHFIELRLHDVRFLTGNNVWKEPAKPNKPAPGNSRCGNCMKEYKQGNAKSHKKNCRPSNAGVVWADRDCASETEVRIRLSGSVIHTFAGLEWMPSSKFAAIMAKNEIVIVRVTQNADGIAA